MLRFNRIGDATVVVSAGGLSPAFPDSPEPASPHTFAMEKPLEHRLRTKAQTHLALQKNGAVIFLFKECKQTCAKCQVLPS